MKGMWYGAEIMSMEQDAHHLSRVLRGGFYSILHHNFRHFGASFEWNNSVEMEGVDFLHSAICMLWWTFLLTSKFLQETATQTHVRWSIKIALVPKKNVFPNN